MFQCKASGLKWFDGSLLKIIFISIMLPFSFVFIIGKGGKGKGDEGKFDCQKKNASS